MGLRRSDGRARALRHELLPGPAVVVDPRPFPLRAATWARLLIAACAPDEQHEIGLSDAFTVAPEGVGRFVSGPAGPRRAAGRGDPGDHPECRGLALANANGSCSTVACLLLGSIPADGARFFFGGQAFSLEPELAAEMPGIVLVGDAREAVEWIDVIAVDTVFLDGGSIGRGPVACSKPSRSALDAIRQAAASGAGAASADMPVPAGGNGFLTGGARCAILTQILHGGIRRARGASFVDVDFSARDLRRANMYRDRPAPVVLRRGEGARNRSSVDPPVRSVLAGCRPAIRQPDGQPICACANLDHAVSLESGDGYGGPCGVVASRSQIGGCNSRGGHTGPSECNGWPTSRLRFSHRASLVRQRRPTIELSRRRLWTARRLQGECSSAADFSGARLRGADLSGVSLGIGLVPGCDL